MTNHEAAADSRRAAALILHYSHRRTDGCNEVLAEAVQAARITELIMALCDLFQHIVPALVTQLGMACLSGLVVDMANTTDGDPDIRRAAQLIAHHGNDNSEALTAVLADADEADRVTELVLAILNLYETLLPPLYSPLGLKTLQQTVLDFAAQEDTDD
ncbi:hypothetical protein [Mycolicibacterium sarraceniae]|uniref:Uncharacterized protein n=1 Tax=Mycolicibacterium sarraceniae TaxID=1534348 RepID=A0A7I7SYU5_9MYCO|nr:hypothetical protein [Mycolicibacterium sarraceniae]BBY61155.1 hypothetical protein MSAR_42910 [Mycolicibacterium sarraceniae]